MVGEPCGASGLWSGVSGVPGLGVSIPRPVAGPRLAEWDRPCRPEGPAGPRRELGPRSSSCRSSGRSTASQESSQPSRHSAHSSSGRRSDSGLSVSGQGSQVGRRRPEGHRREGGRRAGRGGVGGPPSLPPPCHCVCTCGDPVPPKPVRRVMFSDESCSCSDEERLRSLPARGGPPLLPARGPRGEDRGPRGEDCGPRGGSAGEEESSGCCSASPVPSHYKSPKEVDGDYSYAYSDSVSPAFLIRVGAVMEYSGSGEEEDEGDLKENIYEEIRDKVDEQQVTGDSRKSSSSSHEVSVGSSGSGGSVTKSRFQKALDAVTRRSSRSLEHGDRTAGLHPASTAGLHPASTAGLHPASTAGLHPFHLSISKGRKKSLIDRAQVDWDCDPEACGLRSRLNRSSSSMLEEVGAAHSRVISQLQLDVEDMLMPPPSPPQDETQDDSGFHSGGMSSSTSTEETKKSKKKSIVKMSKSTKRSESQPGRMNRCQSIDLKDPSDHYRARAGVPEQQPVYGHYPALPLHPAYGAPPLLPGRKATLGRSYLSRLASLPFLGRQPPPVYGKSNHQSGPQSFPSGGQQGYGEEQGRAFYL